MLHLLNIDSGEYKVDHNGRKFVYYMLSESDRSMALRCIGHAVSIFYVRAADFSKTW